MENFLQEFIKSTNEFFNNEKDRRYEVLISSWAKMLEDDTLDILKKYAKDNSKNIFERKSCFFTVFTYYRKNFMLQDMEDLIDDFKTEPGFDFNNDPLLYHIELLYKVKQSSSDQYERLFSYFENKLNGKSAEEYNNFIGFLNHYVELCASYYEMNLELRYNDKGFIECKRLESALKYSNKCCEFDPDYPKLYVNKGRILALLGNYSDAEREIKKGIKCLQSDSYRKGTLISFTASLDKITSIVAFDSSFKAIKECEQKQNKLVEDIAKTRIENIKNISIIATLLSLVLGGIHAFASISDYKVIGLVMLMYSGLVLLATGAISLTFSLGTYKGKPKPASVIISVCLLIVGISLFIIGLILKV